MLRKSYRDFGMPWHTNHLAELNLDQIKQNMIKNNVTVTQHKVPFNHQFFALNQNAESFMLKRRC